MGIFLGQLVRLDLLVMVIIGDIKIDVGVFESVGFDSLFVGFSFNEKDVHKCENDDGEEFGLDSDCGDHIF